MKRSLIILMIFSLVGCGVVRDAKARAEAAEKRRAEHIAKLKSYVPANVLPTVNPEFYTESGFRDWWRIPLVYPYSIHCINTLNSGHLCIYDGKAIPNDEHIVQTVGRLTAFNFDAHFLVGFVDEEAIPFLDKPAVTKWVLFDFKKGSADPFASKDDLAAAAKARGYSGDMELTTVEAQYKQCFD